MPETSPISFREAYGFRVRSENAMLENAQRRHPSRVETIRDNRAGRDVAVATDALMHQFSDWTEGQLASMRPYLQQSPSPSFDDHLVDKYVRGNFRAGVNLTVARLLDTIPNVRLDIEGTIAGFALGFTEMVHTAEELRVEPALGLMLAVRSAVHKPAEIRKLMEEHPDVSPNVVAKAALSEKKGYTPERFIQIYQEKDARRASLERQFPGYDELDYVYAAVHGLKVETVADAREKLAQSHPITHGEKGWVHVEGFTPQRMLTNNWCGITTTTMDLQRLGNEQVSQASVLRAELGDIDLVAEMIDPVHGPTLGNLSRLVPRLSEHRARFLNDKNIAGLFGVENPEMVDTQNVSELIRKFIDADKPPHIRSIKHTVMVTGYKKGPYGRYEYSILDPREGEEVVVDEITLESKLRCSKSDSYNGAKPYTMMVLHPKKPPTEK